MFSSKFQTCLMPANHTLANTKLRTFYNGYRRQLLAAPLTYQHFVP